MRLLPERDPHAGALRRRSTASSTASTTPAWPAPMVVRFELQLLAELGFGLDLDAMRGDRRDRRSRFTCRRNRAARCRATAGEPWADRMLRLPAFLRDADAPAGRPRCRRRLRAHRLFPRRATCSSRAGSRSPTSARISSRRSSARCRAWRERNGSVKLRCLVALSRAVDGRAPSVRNPPTRRNCIRTSPTWRRCCGRARSTSRTRWRCSPSCSTACPTRVKVYPTENYYYFTLHAQRLALCRQYPARRQQPRPGQGAVRLLRADHRLARRHAGRIPRARAADGVKLEKLERLRYRLTYKDKSVVFELNDLSSVKPPAKALSPHETFIGPIFDEFRHPLLSGLQFRAQQFPLYPRRDRARSPTNSSPRRSATASWSASAPALRSTATSGSSGKS